MSNESEPGLAERLNGKLYRLFLALALAYAMLNGFQPMMNQADMGWHVAQGRWMVEHAAIYRHDVLNYPDLGHPVIDEYPLFQVALYLAWSLGWWGPCLLTALVYAGLLVVLIRAGRLFHLEGSSLYVLSIGCMLWLLQVAFPLRPHMVTFLAIPVFGVFLLAHREEKTWTAFWPLALFQVAWANSHSGFVVGPAMVGLFGAEMILRHSIRDRSFPFATFRLWAAASLFILLACFLNPFGAERFYPPFFQDHLESIRAYVGEMQPLRGAVDRVALIGWLAVAAMFLSRFNLSYSFLLLAIYVHVESLEVKKYWPVFGLFLSLLVLSSAAFSPSPRIGTKAMAWLGLLLHFMVLALLALALLTRLDGALGSSLTAQWAEYNHGRNDISTEAAVWMKSHKIEGRLFHRSEDGGILQQSGYDHGETFGETGFGKFDEDFIHEICVACERPALLPHYLDAYHPDFVVCGNFSYQWPYYLRQIGWRLLFYSPNSSVWARPGAAGTGNDLPTVGPDEIETAFDNDIRTYGRPNDLVLFGRNIVALNSLGLEDFAFVKLRELPPDLHHSAWYWEAARLLCFQTPAFTSAHRDALMHEAEQLDDDAPTAAFRAHDRDAANDDDGALRILEAIPADQLSDPTAELLLRLYLDRHRPEALALARRTDCFDLRNGRHWEYLAQAEEQAGHREAAARAWRKALFYYPDEADLIDGARAFATRTSDAELAGLIAKSSRVYGAER